MDRRETRRSVALPARYRTTRWTEPARIHDITAHGCRLELPTAVLRGGDPVVLRPEGLAPIPATVRWVRDKEVGAEFDRPLYPAVVDHLCARYPGQAAAMPVEMEA